MLLTLELLPVLLDTAASSGDVRIIFVTSLGHKTAESFNTELLNKTEENYKRFKDYSNTKLYNVSGVHHLPRDIFFIPSIIAKLETIPKVATLKCGMVLWMEHVFNFLMTVAIIVNGSYFPLSFPFNQHA